jgi:hypothetical protein
MVFEYSKCDNDFLKKYVLILVPTKLMRKIHLSFQVEPVRYRHFIKNCMFEIADVNIMISTSPQTI